MLHDALRLIRVFHDINQTKLSKQLRISKSYLSEIESGKKPVTIEILSRYSKIFSIPVSSLLLFSERIKENRFSGRTRIFAAKKILRILDWISAKDNGNNEKVA
jgi:transcriptional regulator with XRE-family HTH domain